MGTGKSLAAGCVANMVMDRGLSARFVSAAEAVTQGREAGDALLEAELLVLDDLGAERSTSFGRERVFQLVDRRLLTGRPLIVTTNLPLSAMQHPADLDERRIYDRVLEVCVPIHFDGESMRARAGAEKRKLAAKLLSEE